MNPYQKVVVVTVRTLAIFLFLYYLVTRGPVVIRGLSADSLFWFFYTFGSPVALYFLAKPIAWLATLGIK